jgi:hypothetical protein
VVDLWNADATAEDIRSDQDAVLHCLEVSHGVLSLELRTIAVYEEGGKTLVVEVTIKLFDSALAVTKNESAAGLCRHEQVA